jgi:hypothetical protein
MPFRPRLKGFLVRLVLYMNRARSGKRELTRGLLARLGGNTHSQARVALTSGFAGAPHPWWLYLAATSRSLTKRRQVGALQKKATLRARSPGPFPPLFSRRVSGEKFCSGARKAQQTIPENLTNYSLPMPYGAFGGLYPDGSGIEPSVDGTEPGLGGIKPH